MKDLAELAQRGLEWIRPRLEAGAEAEVFLSRAVERGLELRDGRVESVSETRGEGAGLRLLSGGRMAFASAGSLSLETLQQLYARVLPQLPHIEPDESRALPAPAKAEPDPALERSLWDESLFTRGWDSVAPALREMEAATLKADKRIGSVLRAGYGESRGEVVVASTRGVLAVERGGSASVGLSALAESGGESQVGSAFQSSRRRDALDFAKAAREAAERTTALLGATKLPGGRRSVVIDPWVAGEFLDLVSSLLCADQVQRGKSLLAGKRGARVASELVTFVDDPRLAGGLASSFYDDEGCPTATQTMVDRGVLREYFYDATSAKKEGRGGNSCASRGSYKSLPSPSPSNFFLAPGRASRADLIADTQDGILVLEVMGMHMADPISGELSVGVSGLAIEKGRITHPVKSAMISGNLVELLDRVDAVADDLTFYGSLGAPTFRIAHMTVA